MAAQAAGGPLAGTNVAEWTSDISTGAKPEGAARPPAASLEDAALLKRCREGEMMAFGRLVRKYQDRLYNGLLRMCQNRDDAEELCQETFVKALENLGTFRQDAGFYTWLFRIGMNLTITRRRRAGRVKFHSLDKPVGRGDGDEAGRTDVMPDRSEPGPAERAGRVDDNRRVMDALAALPEEFRSAVVLRDVEGMGYEQISQVLELPVGTVKSRLYRGRCMLRDTLKDLME
ncbi:MAG TPA: sigma-70 family RNA polymerase sigma factor [Phycisphaerae bacterium]|nr:sigma-70 family RNA polymerase sigma factor [Phycisphaerae bacterium]HUU21798.1 sigma-70 family RNA polymerase sigma factor [Phycisphaerae bacterium]